MKANHNTKVVLSECKQCGKSYDRLSLKRSLGEFSAVYTIGFCSAQCYTKQCTTLGLSSGLTTHMVVSDGNTIISLPKKQHRKNKTK